MLEKKALELRNVKTRYLRPGPAKLNQTKGILNKGAASLCGQLQAAVTRLTKGRCTCTTTDNDINNKTISITFM